MPTHRHVLITGGNGYIGMQLVALALDKGYFVTILGRSPEGLEASALRSFPWRLGDTVPFEAFISGDGHPPVDAVIHLAHQWNADRPEADDENVVGTERLLHAVRAAGIGRFVFASSVSARADALNRYGRVKARITEMLSRPGEAAARIGLVYGGPPAGMWGTLCRLVTIAPVIPMVDAHKGTQPIHLNDLCVGLIRMASVPSLSRKVYGLAAPVPIAFGAFLKILARERYGRALFVVPVPGRFALLLADLSASIPFGPAVDRERVLGLMGLPTIETAADLEDLGISLRPLVTGLIQSRGGAEP